MKIHKISAAIHTVTYINHLNRQSLALIAWLRNEYCLGDEIRALLSG